MPPVRPITPADKQARGCQLSLKVPHDAKVMFDALSQQSIVVDFREPDVIRAAPAPFYNSFEDAWNFADALRQGVRE